VSQELWGATTNVESQTEETRSFIRQATSLPEATAQFDGLCRPKVKPHSADGRCPCCAKDPTRKRSGQNSDTEINYKDTLCIPRETVINVEVLGEMEVGQEQG